MKYKIKVYDEMHDLYLLFRKKWLFWSFVSAGKKDDLIAFVNKKNGQLISIK